MTYTKKRLLKPITPDPHFSRKRTSKTGKPAIDECTLGWQSKILETAEDFGITMLEAAVFLIEHENLEAASLGDVIRKMPVVMERIKDEARSLAARTVKAIEESKESPSNFLHFGLRKPNKINVFRGPEITSYPEVAPAAINT
jgi:hypothetical protein